MNHLTEALSSDEDEVDENNTSYLENMKNFATKKANQSGFEMSAELKVSVMCLRVVVRFTVNFRIRVTFLSTFLIWLMNKHFYYFIG